MLELPVSKDIKELYKEKNMEFTDSEKATIFWNSLLPFNEILEGLKEISETTDDEVLKVQIQKCFDEEREKEMAFMNRDSIYIHSVKLDEADDFESVFVSVDAAILYGKENCEATFEICKMIPEDRLESRSKEGGILGGNAVFKKDGTIIDCRCYDSYDTEITIMNAVEPDDFREAYIEVLNPFEYGDIVHVMGDTRLAIVVTSQEYWKEYKTRVKHIMPQNYDMNSLTVEFLYPDGEFSHGHPNIFLLEKVTEWEDEKEWELLQAVSALMKGKGWIEEVIDKYRTNKWDKE